jgi:hypothetical protein
MDEIGRFDWIAFCQFMTCVVIVYIVCASCANKGGDE